MATETRVKKTEDENNLTSAAICYDPVPLGLDALTNLRESSPDDDDEGSWVVDSSQAEISEQRLAVLGVKRVLLFFHINSISIQFL